MVLQSLTTKGNFNKWHKTKVSFVRPSVQKYCDRRRISFGGKQEKQENGTGTTEGRTTEKASEDDEV